METKREEDQDLWLSSHKKRGSREFINTHCSTINLPEAKKPETIDISLYHAPKSMSSQPVPPRKATACWGLSPLSSLSLGHAWQIGPRALGGTHCFSRDQWLQPIWARRWGSCCQVLLETGTGPQIYNSCFFSHIFYQLPPRLPKTIPTSSPNCSLNPSL